MLVFLTHRSISNVLIVASAHCVCHDPLGTSLPIPTQADLSLRYTLFTFEIGHGTNSWGLTHEYHCSAIRRCPPLLSDTSNVVTQIWEHDAGKIN